MINLLFFSGSTQRLSLNTQLAQASAALTKNIYGAGVQTSLIDLTDYDLPSFPEVKGDLPDLPDVGIEFRNLLQNADGVFMSADEYSGTYSTTLRNLIGWLIHTKGSSGSGFEGKPVALIGAAPGGVGGLRGQPALCQFMETIGANVISQHIKLGTAGRAFDAQKNLMPGVAQQLSNGAIAELMKAAG
jgi:chromate reductase